MGRPPAALMRALADAGVIAALGLLTAVAVGAVVTAGLDLLLPELLAAGSPAEALGHSVRFGLASLNVPLSAPGVTGNAVPLTGLVAAFATLASSVRRRSPGWSTASLGGSAATAVAFACLCWLAAVATRTGEAGASPRWALAYGLMFAGTAAAAGRSTAKRDATGAAPPAARVAAARSVVVLVLRAGGLAAAWLLAVGVVAAATGAATLPQVLGAGLLAAAFAPNVLGGVVALGAGARVEFELAYGDGTVASLEGLALWDPGDGIALWHVLPLVLVPLLATMAAAGVTPQEAALRRGLRIGLALGFTLFVLARVGAFFVTVTGAGAAGIRVGVAGAPAFALGVAWGVAGSFLARWLPRPAGRPRLRWR